MINENKGYWLTQYWVYFCLRWSGEFVSDSNWTALNIPALYGLTTLIMQNQIWPLFHETNSCQCIMCFLWFNGSGRNETWWFHACACALIRTVDAEFKCIYLSECIYTLMTACALHTNRKLTSSFTVWFDFSPDRRHTAHPGHFCFFE